MTEPCVVPLADTFVKIGLTVLGALVGASVTAYVARTKLHRLTPSIRHQVQALSMQLKATYSASEAAACATQIDPVLQTANEMIAANIAKKTWQQGLVVLRDAKQAALHVSAAAPELVPDATQRVRDHGAKLASWCAAL